MVRKFVFDSDTGSLNDVSGVRPKVARRGGLLFRSVRATVIVAAVGASLVAFGLAANADAAATVRAVIASH